MNKVYWNYSMRRNDTYCIKCSYKHLGQEIALLPIDELFKY